MGCFLSTNRSRPETHSLEQVNESEMRQDSAHVPSHSFVDCYTRAMELAERISDAPLPPSSSVRILQDQVVKISLELAQRFHSLQGHSPDYYNNRLDTLEEKLMMARQRAADRLNQRPASSSHLVGEASGSTYQMQPSFPDVWPKIQIS